MNKRVDPKVHYKMYKNGKVWVFAGLATASFLVSTTSLETTTKADTVDTDVIASSADTSPVQTTDSTGSTGESVPSTTSTEVMPDGGSIAASVEQTEQSKSAKVEQSAVAGQKATATSYKTSPTTQNGSKTVNDTDSSTRVKTDIIDTNGATPVENGDAKLKLTNLASQDSDTGANNGIKHENKVATNHALADDNIASGGFGTSSWYIDAAGVLHFGEGTFGKGIVEVVFGDEAPNNSMKWGRYADQITSISFDGKVKAHVSSGGLFCGLPNLTRVQHAENFDLSSAEFMSSMFAGDAKLTDIDVSSWDVSNVGAFQRMFMGASSLKTLDVSNWHVGAGIEFDYMFKGMTSLETLDVSKWNMSSALRFEYMFKNDSSLKMLDVSDWDISKAQNMNEVFDGMTALETLDVSHWNLTSAVRMSAMFRNTSSLKVLDVSRWDLPNGVAIPNLFNGSGITSLDVSKWDVSKVGGFEGTFANIHVPTLDFSNWDTSNVQSMKEMFANSTFDSLDVTSFDTSNVTNMERMFLGTNVERLDLSSFDTSKVEKITSMFQGASNIKRLDISNFDIENVSWKTDMLAGMTSLRVIVLGPKSAIDGTNLPELNIPGSLNYWVEVGDGTEDYPKGEDFWSSASLMHGYISLAHGSMTGTYVVAPYRGKLDVVDSTIPAGPKQTWDPSDNYKSGSGYNGDDIYYPSIKITGTVDPQVPGDYQITYTYEDRYGNRSNILEETITVHVTASQVSVDGKDSTIIAGPNQTWEIADNFIGATDENGNALDLSDIKERGYVEPQVPGDYDVTYSYADKLGNEVSETIIVHVVASQVSVDGEDSTIVTGPSQTWSAADNFIKATDGSGNPVDLDKIKIEGTVNPQALGDYDITYSYVDEVGNPVSETITVHVVASQVSIDGKDSTIIAGPSQTWTAADNFVNATDGRGNVVDLDQVKVEGTVNSQVPGDYKITYRYIDEAGNPVSKTITVHVVASQVSIDGKDSTIIAGPSQTWSTADNFVSATDGNGNAVDLDKVKVEGTVNAQVPGDYKVTYRYIDEAGNVVNKTITVHVVVSQVSIDGKDSTIIAGPNQTWSAADNFVSATDASGNAINVDKVKSESNVNPQMPGEYSVTYSYTDEAGNVVNKTITVHVIASQVSIDGKDSTLIAGPNQTWNAADNFVSAADASGNKVDLGNVKIEGNANPHEPGDYEVTYRYTDEVGNEVSKTVTIHIIASQASIDGEDRTLIAGPDQTWNKTDNFISATDANGNAVALDQVQVEGSVSPQVPGDYEVTYRYTDEVGNVVSETITIHVVASQADIVGKDSTVTAGPNQTWTAADNFVSATDANGNEINLDDVKVEGKVDPTTLGDYEVTYRYIDEVGNEIVKTVVVHVVASQTSIDSEDSTIIAGPNQAWNAADNFVGATDLNGNEMNLNDVKIEGNVNPQVPGDYEVIYHYTDELGNVVSETSTVHVVASQASVDSEDSTIIAGPNQTWNAVDNFVNATDGNGNPVDMGEVKIEANVNPQTPGDYVVTYSYTDAVGNTVSETNTVHVVSSQVSIDGKDGTIIAGPNQPWTMADNFVGATDENGNPVGFADVQVEGAVDSTTPGDYEVTYRYTDALGNMVSETNTVHVVTSRANVDGKSSTIIAGPNQTWTGADNFVEAMDANGNSIDLGEVKVEASVDPQVPGDYEITYSYTDEVGNVVSDTSTVHVVTSRSSVDGKDSTMIAGPNQTWAMADNFVSATDVDGNPIDLSKVRTEGHVDPQTPGDYEVTYLYTDKVGNVMSKTITVHVVASRTNVDGKDSTLIAGPNQTWDVADNFVSAMDENGSTVNLEEIKIEGNVEPQIPGDYEVTYIYTDKLGNEINATITVHVVASQSKINSKDSTIIAGPNQIWNVDDNLVGVTDASGQDVDLSEVKAEGEVDPQAPGDYEVTYSYMDDVGNLINKAITVHVVVSQCSVQGKDSTIIAGAERAWDPVDNFVGATDAKGHPVNFADIQVEGEVDSSMPGDYEVTYRYTDEVGNTVSETVVIHVITEEIPNDGDQDVNNDDPDAKTDSKQQGDVQENQLPQTGDQDETTTSEVGSLGLLAGMFGGFGLGKKRKN